ncbi:MAG: hypothetical protein QXL14_00365 [Candidatus Aenigmatarchaeota archaeon]
MIKTLSILEEEKKRIMALFNNGSSEVNVSLYDLMSTYNIGASSAYILLSMLERCFFDFGFDVVRVNRGLLIKKRE